MARVLKVGMRDSLSRISIAVSAFDCYGRFRSLKRKNEKRDYYMGIGEDH